jgi:hypothetical protein
MKVIPQTRHSLYIIYLSFYFYFTMSVPDEGYSTNTLFELHYISSFLFLFYYERTWWRLFLKHVIRTTLYIFVSIFILLWSYLMKVIPQTRHSHYIGYLRFYFYFTMIVPDEGSSTNTSFALHYISSFLFLIFYERTWWSYSTNTSFELHYISSFLFLFYYERSWWRLFQKHVIHTTLAIFVFYLYFTMSVPDEGYSTNTSFALH